MRHAHTQGLMYVAKGQPRACGTDPVGQKWAGVACITETWHGKAVEDIQLEVDSDLSIEAADFMQPPDLQEPFEFGEDLGDTHMSPTWTDSEFED